MYLSQLLVCSDFAGADSVRISQELKRGKTKLLFRKVAPISVNEILDAVDPTLTVVAYFDRDNCLTVVVAERPSYFELLKRGSGREAYERHIESQPYNGKYSAYFVVPSLWKQ